MATKAELQQVVIDELHEILTKGAVVPVEDDDGNVEHVRVTPAAAYFTAAIAATKSESVGGKKQATVGEALEQAGRTKPHPGLTAVK